MKNRIVSRWVVSFEAGRWERRAACVAAVVAGSLVGCGEPADTDDGNGPSLSGGSGGLASGGQASGGVSSGGGSTSSGGTGGLGSGGLGSGGLGSGGVAASGGMPGADGGSGGSDPGGIPADPSPGCGSPSASVSIQNALVGTPDGYDGSTPVPVVFGFHAANNPATQLQDRFQDGPLGDNYLMIYLSAQNSGGWTLANDQGRFDTAYTEVLSEACIDQNRVYAVGHSSGAQFIVQLLCAGEDRFDAVVPIASSVYCSSWTAVPALNIHGTDDDERWAYGLNDGDGAKDIVPYRTSNGCSATSVPSAIDTNGCSASITPGCVDFEGCTEPTTWCNHDDPQYGTTNHGIPCFASSAIFDFLENFQ